MSIGNTHPINLIISISCCALFSLPCHPSPYFHAALQLRLPSVSPHPRKQIEQTGFYYERSTSHGVCHGHKDLGKKETLGRYSGGQKGKCLRGRREGASWGSKHKIFTFSLVQRALSHDRTYPTQLLDYLQKFSLCSFYSLFHFAKPCVKGF